jgi:4-hydroxy-2-oxoheptanedioate aldolase
MRFGSPETVEILGAMGFDFIRFNLEHELFGDRELIHCIRAADSFGITPMVRLPLDQNLIRRCLEAGVQGVHVARINNADDAQRVVSAVRFRPIGDRTFSATGRAGNYGVGLTEKQVLEAANREVMIILQIEEADGIKNLDEILEVPSVDAIQIGPKDLWQSMDFAETDEVWGVIEKALAQVVAAGKWPSMVYWIGSDANREKMSRYGDLGVRMLSILQGEVIAHGAHAFLEEARSIVQSS